MQTVVILCLGQVVVPHIATATWPYVGEAVEADCRRRALTVRQRQFVAVLNQRRRLEIARRIVAAKLPTLDLYPADTREFRRELIIARTLEDILTVEACAGAAFFMRFRGY